MSLSLQQRTVFFSVSLVSWNIPCFFKDTVKMTITIFRRLTLCALTVIKVIILTVFCYVHQCFRSTIIVRLYDSGNLLNA